MNIYCPKPKCQVEHIIMEDTGNYELNWGYIFYNNKYLTLFDFLYGRLYKCPKCHCYAIMLSDVEYKKLKNVIKRIEENI